MIINTSLFRITSALAFITVALIGCHKDGIQAGNNSAEELWDPERAQVALELIKSKVSDLKSGQKAVKLKSVEYLRETTGLYPGQHSDELDPNWDELAVKWEEYADRLSIAIGSTVPAIEESKSADGRIDIRYVRKILELGINTPHHVFPPFCGPSTIIAPNL